MNRHAQVTPIHPANGCLVSFNETGEWTHSAKGIQWIVFCCTKHFRATKIFGNIRIEFREEVEERRSECAIVAALCLCRWHRFHMWQTILLLSSFSFYATDRDHRIVNLLEGNCAASYMAHCALQHKFMYMLSMPRILFTGVPQVC